MVWGCIFDVTNTVRYLINRVMEITNEIKEKLFAQYLGQSWKWDMRGTPILKLYTSDIVEIDRFDWGQNVKLILKPLSSITDEDAIEASIIIGGASHLSKESQIKQLRDLFSSPYFWVNQENISGYKWFICCQFLQSKGYDLPNYFLNGKTLNEVGLAIYEK